VCLLADFGELLNPSEGHALIGSCLFLGERAPVWVERQKIAITCYIPLRGKVPHKVKGCAFENRVDWCWKSLFEDICSLPLSKKERNILL